MALTCAENMRRYRARIASDPIRRQQYLAKDRLRRQRKAARQHDTRQKQGEIQKIQVKNNLVLVDSEVLDSPPGYKHIEKTADAAAKTLSIHGEESTPLDNRMKLYGDALLHYINDLSVEEKMQPNPLGPLLSPSTPPLALVEPKRRRREWSSPPSPNRLAGRHQWEPTRYSGKRISWVAY